MISDIVDVVVSYGSVQTILTLELNVRCVTAKFVPRLLTPEQKVETFGIEKSLCEVGSEDVDRCPQRNPENCVQ
jgi:hypothetical protein